MRGFLHCLEVEFIFPSGHNNRGDAIADHVHERRLLSTQPFLGLAQGFDLRSRMMRFGTVHDAMIAR
jgi:hypothetical protein